MLKQFKKIFNRKNNKKGFSLVEIMIVLASFSILMTASFGILASSIRSQRYVLATSQLLDQTGFSLDYMSRSIRMAKKHLSVSDPIEVACGFASVGDNFNPASAQASTSIQFLKIEVDPDTGIKTKKCIKFFLDSGKILKDTTDAGGTMRDQISPSSINVTNLKIYVSGGSQTDNFQPRVSITLEAKPVANIKPVPTVKLQSTVSQRDLDIAE